MVLGQNYFSTKRRAVNVRNHAHHHVICPNVHVQCTMWDVRCPLYTPFFGGYFVPILTEQWHYCCVVWSSVVYEANDVVASTWLFLFIKYSLKLYPYQRKIYCYPPLFMITVKMLDFLSNFAFVDQKKSVFCNILL